MAALVDDKHLPVDVNALTSKADVSAQLFGKIAWAKMAAAGVFLDHKKVGVVLQHF